MAFQADYIRRPYEIGVVSRSVNIMATETPDTVCVHRAGYEIISLHPILVGCSLGGVCERGFAKPVVLQLPEALQVEADVIANWPVVVPAFDRILYRPSLGMALNANVVRRDEVRAGWIDD